MTDDLDRVFDGVDGERALPAAARERLEATLASQPWSRTDEAALPGAMALDERMTGLDAERPVPPAVRERLERRLARRRVPLAQRSVAAAAVVVLLAAAGVIVLRGDEPPGTTDVAGPPATGAAAPGVTLDPSADPRPDEPGIAPGEAGGTPGGGVGLPAGPSGATAGGPAPPYAFSTTWFPEPAAAPGLAAPDAGDPAEPAAPTPPLPPLTVAVVRGGAAQEAGFRRYVSLLNEAGGISGRTLRMVTASADEPAPAGTLATVNLSGAPIGTPGWTRGPVLEGLEATEATLTGRVFGLSSPPERQARLAVAAMYPEPVTEPTTAVIYLTGGGPFGEIVPAAMQSALEAKGVTVARVTFRTSGGANLFVPADVAFLSMDASASSLWFAQTAEAGYEPFSGIAGIYPLMDSRLLASMDGRRVSIVGPYARPDTQETNSQAFNRGSLAYPVGHAHGWATAKTVAVAIWRSDVHRAGQMPGALRRLTGWSNGFGPRYEVRPGTNARTPEGMLFTVEDGRFVARSGFLRDA